MTAMNAALPDRDLRQRDIVPPQRLKGLLATVIGTGAIGRQVALQLAAMGVPALQLIDPDTVETVNLAPQGFLVEDLGQAKVHAVAELCRRINPAMILSPVHARFRRSFAIGKAVFCCVDSVQTREHIWRAVADEAAFYADGRMNGEVIRILAASGTRSRAHYPTTLFAANEAHTGACTARSTIFTASIAAGLMVEQFTRYLRGIQVDSDVQFNLLSMELTVG